jgi:deoxycytidine triphosphate deaminase
MILTGKQIVASYLAGDIIIDPFLPENVNPNSYNFRIDRELKTYTCTPLDPKLQNPYKDIIIPEEGLILEPRVLYLANTVEVLGSTAYAPTFNARSSIARLGVFINLSASLCDIGFIGQLTLQIFAIQPVKIYPYMNIGQMMFWKPFGSITLYEGKYQGSRGAQTTQIYKDFDDGEDKIESDQKVVCSDL